MTTDRAAICAALKLKAAPAKATADVAWNKAIRTHWVSLTAEERAAGWPDAFTPENLARLQYPYEGTDPEKKRARRDQAALLDALRASIETGTLAALERTRTVPKMREVPVRRDEFEGGDRAVSVDVDCWKSIGGRVRRVEDGTEEVSYRAIERAAFREFLAAQGIEPSAHIRAWLRPLEQAEEAHQEEAAVPETLTPTKRAAIIERLGRRYPALESALDRPEEWAKACRVPNKRGWYYLERIEAECRARYGAAAPAQAADLSPAGQLHRIGR